MDGRKKGILSASLESSKCCECKCGILESFREKHRMRLKRARKIANNLMLVMHWMKEAPRRMTASYYVVVLQHVLSWYTTLSSYLLVHIAFCASSSSFSKRNRTIKTWIVHIWPPVFIYKWRSHPSLGRHLSIKCLWSLDIKAHKSVARQPVSRLADPSCSSKPLLVVALVFVVV